jgi:hypothetical protein
MTNVGTLIATESGLRTVVQVLPGHVDPALSSVITEPLEGDGGGWSPSEFFGTPLPGQAQSAANFVQTMIFPSDDSTDDSSSAAQTSSPQASSQASGSSASVSEADWPDSSSSASSNQSADQSGAGNSSTNAQPASNSALQSQAFVQAASAYQTTQQRGSDDAHRPAAVG